MEKVVHSSPSSGERQARIESTKNPPVADLHRHFGLLHAVALNVSMIVGAGVFATIPLMLLKVPGPYALLGWLAAGLVMLMDGLVWSELGAALPGSGGSYVYLLESYGKDAGAGGWPSCSSGSFSSAARSK